MCLCIVFIGKIREIFYFFLINVGKMFCYDVFFILDGFLEFWVSIGFFFRGYVVVFRGRWFCLWRNIGFEIIIFIGGILNRIFNLLYLLKMRIWDVSNIVKLIIT